MYTYTYIYITTDSYVYLYTHTNYKRGNKHIGCTHVCINMRSPCATKVCSTAKRVTSSMYVCELLRICVKCLSSFLVGLIAQVFELVAFTVLLDPSSRFLVDVIV